MNQPTNICEKRNRLTLCVHIVLKMMQCWRKKNEAFNPFPNEKCYRLDQPTEFADENFMFFFLNGEKFVKQVKTLLGKGETAHY